MPHFRITLVAALSAVLGFAQPVGKPLTFEVASVKPAAPPAPGEGRSRGLPGPGTPDPGRIRYRAIRLKDLLVNAYSVEDYQIAGPAWLDRMDNSARFDIDATMPPGTAKEQLRVMLQNLLVERFQLALHRETRELPMWALVLGRNGPRMKPAAEVASQDDSPPPMPPPPARKSRGGLDEMDADGFPLQSMVREGRGGTWLFVILGRGTRIGGRLATMQDLADELTRRLKIPVKDATALTGKYDFTLTFSSTGSDGPMAPDASAPVVTPTAAPPEAREPMPDLFAALQSQLGLRLEAKKGPLELLVIDHLERTPTAN